jgi:hypothetical protein
MNLTRRSLISVAATLAPLIRAAEQSALRTQLLGAWKLLEAFTLRPSGEAIGWMGRQAPFTGLIIYSPSGMMSVQIASVRPAATAPPDIDDMAAAQRLTYLGTYYGYFGRFELDEATSEVHHIIESSLDPTETGKTLIRHVTLVDDRLTLTTPPRPVKGEMRFNRLTWARA